MHLTKYDYSEIKDRLTMQQVAEYYGYHADRNGLILCPFHKDKHPSCKLYGSGKGFYCFSCGKGGDVITFTGALFGLQNETSAKKLIEDFNLQIKTDVSCYAEYRKRNLVIAKRKEQERAEKRAFAVLKRYRMLLCEAYQERFASPHFEEALMKLDYIEYLIECLEEDPAGYLADKGAMKQIDEIAGRITNWT